MICSSFAVFIRIFMIVYFSILRFLLSINSLTNNLSSPFSQEGSEVRILWMISVTHNMRSIYPVTSSSFGLDFSESFDMCVFMRWLALVSWRYIKLSLAFAGKLFD